MPALRLVSQGLFDGDLVTPQSLQCAHHFRALERNSQLPGPGGVQEAEHFLSTSGVSKDPQVFSVVFPFIKSLSGIHTAPAMFHSSARAWRQENKTIPVQQTVPSCGH